MIEIAGTSDQILQARCKVWCPGNCIPHGEWIKWVLKRYADAEAGSDLEGVKCIRPYIRCKRTLRQGAIPESAHIFEVSKELQILIAKFAIERAIEIFAIDRGECRGSVREVKGIIPP